MPDWGGHMNLSLEAWRVAREHVDWVNAAHIEPRNAMDALLPGFAALCPIIPMHEIDLTVAVAIAWMGLHQNNEPLREAA